MGYPCSILSQAVAVPSPNHEASTDHKMNSRTFVTLDVGCAPPPGVSYSRPRDRRCLVASSSALILFALIVFSNTYLPSLVRTGVHVRRQQTVTTHGAPEGWPTDDPAHCSDRLASCCCWLGTCSICTSTVPANFRSSFLLICPHLI